MKTARVVGWTLKGNIGDDSYRIAFPRFLQEYNVCFQSRMNPDQDADLIILGGGDIVREGFTKSFSPEQVAKTVVASVGVNESSDFDFLARCRRVIVRDSESIARCLGRGVGAEYLPDFAFLLEPDAERGRRWLRDAFGAEGRDLYEKVVACVPNAYTFFGGHESKYRDTLKALHAADDLAWVFDNTSASVVFLPFGTQSPADDRVPASYINSRTKFYKKNLVVHDRLDVQTTLDIVAACDSLVGNRLHALIFATLGGVPFVALDHHSKITDYCSGIATHWGSWSVPFYSLARQSVHQLLEGNLSDGNSAPLLEYARNAREQILANRLK